MFSTSPEGLSDGSYTVSALQERPRQGAWPWRGCQDACPARSLQDFDALDSLLLEEAFLCLVPLWLFFAVVLADEEADSEEALWA
jgi:hypothetical protein